MTPYCPYYSEHDIWCKNCAPENAYPEPGGEADTPLHCANPDCEALLNVALTPDGREYVRDTLAYGVGRAEILLQWAERWPDCVPETP